MAGNFEPILRHRSKNKVKKNSSSVELTFSYVFDCLKACPSSDSFLGFTMSRKYHERHKNDFTQLLELRFYFDIKILQAMLIYIVPRQSEPVIKWTDKLAMESYLARKTNDSGFS